MRWEGALGRWDKFPADRGFVVLGFFRDQSRRDQQHDDARLERTRRILVASSASELPQHANPRHPQPLAPPTGRQRRVNHVRHQASLLCQGLHRPRPPTVHRRNFAHRPTRFSRTEILRRLSTASIRISKFRIRLFYDDRWAGQFKLRMDLS
jgi:hypothetical protein